MNIKEESLRQFRFIDGTEVICEIMSEDEDELIVRYALKAEKVDMSFSVSYYTFKSWMIYQTGAEDLISINPYHILSVCRPKGEVVDQYYKTLDLVNSEENEDKELDPISRLMNELEEYSDSNHSNVISILDRNKLH